jgi:EAL domain-containing protein (putative c-di-GMP-specific phosphodiesterase class I)
VLEQVCQQTKYWRDNLVPDLVVSVNISPRQFQDATLCDFIAATLQKSVYRLRLYNRKSPKVC